MYVEVLVEIRKIDKTFTYYSDQKIEPGMRVKVPFGHQELEGFVLKVSDQFNGDYEVKDIIEVIDDKPVINSEMLELGKYMSKKYLCSLISAYQTMLPAALKAKNGFKVNKKIVTYLQIDPNFIPKSDKEKQIKDLFLNEPVLKKDANKISAGIVKRLIDNNILKEVLKEEYRLNNHILTKDELPVLTDEQNKVLNEIKLNEFNSYLLFGVTGSGKTEVYMRLIAKAIEQKKQALVLVPEISLTPQLVNTFRHRFDRIAILHSALNDGEKYDEWRKIERHEVDIVIGARSAIFAPLDNIGIIIIDEEHSSTYKQENNPRYNAIDIAIARAKRYNVCLVLGSATPSIESFTRAKMGTYKLLTMTKRVNNELPKVTLIDMKNEIKKGNHIFSKQLYTKINECLDKGEQIILLLNRRGYNTIVTCSNCGYTHKCPKCDIPLTYHKKTNQMKCHYCDYTTYKLNTCPECKSNKFNDFGMGTEKLSELVTENFPKAKVVRMDVDTTKTKSAHEKILTAFKNQDYNILIGTQMISKGLDFPKVTLVGVINGDASLNIPDFRSGERTFQLLNQVAGRAGRSELKGEVIIQGFNIDHYSIVYASKHDYINFYNAELNIRKTLSYPPYYNLALVRLQSRDEMLLQKEADKIGTFFKQHLKDDIVLGPSMALMPKINNVYYMNIIIKYKKTDRIMEPLEYITKKYINNNKISVSVDFNPYHF